jgi:hypothetical protein
MEFIALAYMKCLSVPDTNAISREDYDGDYYYYYYYYCDSSVGIGLGYGLDDRCARVRFPAGAGNFSLHHRVQNGSRVHPASYPVSTTGSFPGGKAAGA